MDGNTADMLRSRIVDFPDHEILVY